MNMLTLSMKLKLITASQILNLSGAEQTSRYASTIFASMYRYVYET